MILDSGKTALAATVGIDSDFPYVKIVSSFPLFCMTLPLCNLKFNYIFLLLNFIFLIGQISAESMIGLHESTKCAQIVKVNECQIFWVLITFIIVGKMYWSIPEIF